MTKRKKQIHIPGFILAAFMLLTILFGSWGAFAYAEESTELGLDNTDVIADLTDGSINGDKFDITDYAFDENGKTTVFTFLEYCYAFREVDQDNYGFYVYVHNPKGIRYIDSVLNTVTIGVYDENGEQKLGYNNYNLKFLNCSNTQYKGLFYKYKVVLSEEQKKAFLGAVSSVKRVYDVPEINLLVDGETNADPVTVEKKFRYEGYAAGYGFDLNDASTLTCYTDYLEVVSLECHSTTYRPEGTNGKNDYTQDSLHSVYFTLPKKFVSKYGKMVGAHGRYLRATLNPFLVTGNQEAYNAILPYLGKTLDPSDLKYRYYGAYEEYMSTVSGSTFPVAVTNRNYGYTYNQVGSDDERNHRIKYGSDVPVLYMLFNAGEGTDSADNYTVRSEDILSALKESKTKFGGELVQGKYSKSMFSSVDSAFTEFNLHTNDGRFEDTEFDIRSGTVSQSWLQKIFGLQSKYSETYPGIKAIEQVTDISLTSEKLASRYYISEADVADFKKVYNENVRYSGDDMYLLRYSVSDYVSQEATLLNSTSKVDTNAYFAQEDVHLDFEIIDITMYNGEYHVIPVAMKPIDVIPAATPPVYTTSDDFWKANSWWLWIVIAIVAVVLLIVLLPFLPTIISVLAKVIVWIVKAVFRIVALPFRGIAALVRAIKERREDK